MATTVNFVYEASPEVIHPVAGRPECWPAAEEVRDVEAVTRRPIWLGRGWGCRNCKNCRNRGRWWRVTAVGMDFCIFCIFCISRI
jgi:hypothetical protein